MNKKVFFEFDKDSKTKIRFLPPYQSSGIHPVYKKYYIRKNESILDTIPIEEIERYLRKKKLKNIL